MKPDNRDSISYRVLRRLFIVLASCMVAVLLVLTFDVYTDEKERQSVLLEKVGQSMAGPIAESIWMVDSAVLQRQLDAMIHIPGVAHVGVSTFIGQEFQADKAGYDGGRKFLVRRIMLRHNDDSLGQLEICGDSDYLFDQVVESTIETIAVQILLLAASLIAIYLVFRKEILLPLNVLSDYVHGVGEGNKASLREQLPPKTCQELVALASAVEELRGVQAGKASIPTDPSPAESAH